MNKRMMIALIFAATGSAASYAEQDCAGKRSVLESELAKAYQSENTVKIAELHTALADVNVNCSSGSIHANLQRHIDKLDAKIHDKQRAIEEAKTDLLDAKSQLDARKIRKYERKISEKLEDLAELQSEQQESRNQLSQLIGS